MSWFDLGGVTWWAVALAFLLTFVFGWVYYSPQGLFPLWARLGKVSADDEKNANMGVAFGGTFLGNLLGVILLALLMAGLGVEGWAAGAATGVGGVDEAAAATAGAAAGAGLPSTGLGSVGAGFEAAGAAMAGTATAAATGRWPFAPVGLKSSRIRANLGGTPAFAASSCRALL